MYGNMVGPSAPDIHTVLRESHASEQALGCSALPIASAVGLDGGELGAWTKAECFGILSCPGPELHLGTWTNTWREIGCVWAGAQA